MEGIKRDKIVFGEEYYIGNLNKSKREEVLRSIGNSISFIV